MSIQTGQTVTIKRGKLSGQAGEVIKANDREVALEMTDGTFTTQNVSNVRVPDALTITEDNLAVAVANAIKGAPDAGVFNPLVADLARTFPGFGDRVGNIVHA